ncbi:MAG: hypothetical protein K9J37_07925 [Saprospiraceae bacterium]|nr:hypothetical protein [Saprospiraceae bacterium]MCF8249826.1 hypothetical protein [Saprospiraceae bacterium]MCF8279504.1 hypothetical protein [Bacteroidales bacterium]MCF8311740.1 hypothetical protein [Saprospiraceae bacterium]MCF8440307.1 hypothetical protein [Saprospiraceae bacterium]
MQSGQAPETALEFNPAWFEWETPVLPGNAVVTVPGSLYPLPPEQDYAWEVKAYVGNAGVEEEIAVSEKRTYKSAPMVERFKAGNPDWNMVTVLTLTSYEDITNIQKRISGIGTMPIRANGELVTLHFSNIIVGPLDDFWELLEGSITEPLNNFNVHLDNSGNPAGDTTNMDNYGVANFNATHVIVGKDDLRLRGRVKWQFPHTVAGGAALIQSMDTTILYNRYQLINAYVAVEGKSFNMLDPANFNITYYPTGGTSHTKFALYNNILTLTLDGEMKVPTSVADMSATRIGYKFQDANNPYYFTQAGLGASANIKLVKNTQIQLDAIAAIFDLSEDESPLKINSPVWKGIYFTNFNIQLPTAFDGSNQIVLEQEQVYNFEPLAGNSFYAWIDRYGLDMDILRTFTGTTGPAAAFNSFKGNGREVKIKLVDNNVSGCVLKGFVYVPFLKQGEEFKYTVPFDNNGLQVSFLDDNLINREVVMRENDADLRLRLIIKQAVFKDHERLDIAMDVEWDALEIEIPNLTEFKIWGNGEIGFREPGGAKGMTNIVGKFDHKFEITAYGIAAGYFGDTYAFNILTNIVMGDENISILDAGTAGAPRAEYFTDVKIVEPIEVGGPPGPPPSETNSYPGAGQWKKYKGPGVKSKLKTGGKIVLFIPIYISYPITAKNAMMVVGVAGAGAAVGAGIGALSADTLQLANYGAHEGVGIHSSEEEESSAQAGAGAGAGIAAGAAVQYLADKNSIFQVVGGFLYRTDDPEWGNAFFGMANATINRPLKYGIQTKLLIGTKNDVHYGLIELTYKGGDFKEYSQPNVLMQALDAVKSVFIAKQTGPPAPIMPSKSIPFGNYNIVEIGGRMYWNMSHNVEKECGDDFKSLIQLGSNPNPASVDLEKLWKFLTTCEKIHMLTSIDSLVPYLCAWRERSPTQFHDILRGLPEIDYDLMRSEVPQIPAYTWNKLELDGVGDFGHLDLLFQDKFCPYIIKAIVKQVQNWDKILCEMPKLPFHPDPCKYNKAKIIKALKKIESYKAAKKEKFLDLRRGDIDEYGNNKIFVEADWTRMEDTIASWKAGPDSLAHKGDSISWPFIAVTYWDVDPSWCKLISQIPFDNWPSLWDPFPPDFLPINWPDSFSIYGRPALPALLSRINSITPTVISNYQVDNSIDFGMSLKVRAENTYVPPNMGPQLSPEMEAAEHALDGMASMVKGVLEMSGGEGSFGQFLLRIDAGMGNAPHPKTIDGSFIKAKGCITYTEKTKTFIANLQAQAINGGVCGQGMLYLEITPGQYHFQLGSKIFPINVIYPCVGAGVPGQGSASGGLGMLGWFELHKNPETLTLGAGIGLSANAFVQSARYGAEFCTFYGYANTFAAAAVFANFQLEPSLEIMNAGFLFGAGVDIGVNFSGTFCPFGNLSALYMYLGGDLTADFRTNKLHGAISGEATLFGLITARFVFPYEKSIAE